MRYDVIAIVASSRGLAPLQRMLERLPADLGVPVVCLAESDAALATQLAAQTRLEVRTAHADERMQPGCVYVAPPGTTPLLVEDRAIALAPYGPESVALQPQDHFLACVAAQYGPRALVVVLGNFKDDGVRGAQAIRERGGTVLVLDRATAAHWGMAEPIVRAGACDRVLGAEDVAEALRAWFTPCSLLECAELQIGLGELLDAALRSSGTRMGNVQVLDPSRRALHVVVHRGVARSFLDGFAVVDAGEETACARALRFRNRVVIEDVEADHQFAPYLDLARAAGFRAVQSTPLFASDARLAGMLSTHFPYPHRLQPEEARMLDDIARAAGPLLTRLWEAPSG